MKKSTFCFLFILNTIALFSQEPNFRGVYTIPFEISPEECFNYTSQMEFTYNGKNEDDYDFRSDNFLGHQATLRLSFKNNKLDSGFILIKNNPNENITQLFITMNIKMRKAYPDAIITDGDSNIGLLSQLYIYKDCSYILSLPNMESVVMFYAKKVVPVTINK